ncbi:hypothetical protein NDU88_000174 [Pleurodeles waltl]|uniref:C2H2-type domain-containing protein n=1 Tax=Pleurodeles waltl TaxID=8319 RepID=A0AAV7P498_PLEWA|nr:hypothetical protein NDU88_000174 [Pleurodeles waltl]
MTFMHRWLEVELLLEFNTVEFMNVKESLATQKRKHTGKQFSKYTESYECCNEREQLTEHQGPHSGEKPHHCPECGKRFRQKAFIAIHRRVHTGEKPYHCTECGKKFSAKCNLIVHQRTHTVTSQLLLPQKKVIKKELRMGFEGEHGGLRRTSSALGRFRFLGGVAKRFCRSNCGGGGHADVRTAVP